MLKFVTRPLINKVLPLVYDNTLSYYEVLGKLIDKDNDIIDYINDNFEKLVTDRLQEVFADCTYDEETETISLSFNSTGV